MTRLTVYPAPDHGYWLDCQSDLFSDLNSRFVVPLHPRTDGPSGDRRLNPIFVIDDAEYVMQTHFAAAIPAALLRKPVATLIEHEFTIGMALDMLINGY